MIRRCACILLVELTNRDIGLSREENIIMILQQSGRFGRNHDDIKNLVNGMLDAGSRFKNMEQAVHMGIALVLGKDIPDSMYVTPSLSYIPSPNFQMDEVAPQEREMVRQSDDTSQPN